MHNHSVFTVFLSIGLVDSNLFAADETIISTVHNYKALIVIDNQILSSSSARKSNANGKVFDLLLGLYKLNPLKSSPVYQSFSNHLLVGMGKHSKDSDLNFKSGESVKEVQTHLNEIEKMIHTRNTKPVKRIEKPAYDLDDVTAEDFIADLVVNNKILSKEDLKTNLQFNLMKEDFGTLFEHIGSNDIDNEMPVTKLLPVKDTIIRKIQMANQNYTLSELTDSKDKSSNHIDTLVELRDQNPENLLDNVIVGTDEVITL